jgi:hypothetical protein
MIEIELPYPFNDLAGPTPPHPGNVPGYLTTLLEYIEGVSSTLHAMAQDDNHDPDPDTLRSVTLLLRELSRSSLTLWRYSQRAGRA